MLKVFKYAVLARDEFVLEMPQYAQILTIQIQAGEPMIWALVDPSAPVEQRRFRLAGTGHPIGYLVDELAYIGTFQCSGVLVFHLFEVLTKD